MISTKIATNAPNNQKARYSDEIKHEVISRYPLCTEPEDKQALADSLGIASLTKLYNLASRLGVSLDYYDCYGPDGKWNIPGAYVPREDTTAWKDREPYSENAFSIEDDNYIKRCFGSQHIEEIRYMCRHTEIAVAYRARHLGLRKACHFWDERRVSAWLNLSTSVLRKALKRMGGGHYPCTDIYGRERIVLVATEEIARLLLLNQSWKTLLENGADEWFVREILESYVALREGKGEECHWVSHGHTCLNALSEDGFDWFYDGSMVYTGNNKSMRRMKELIGKHYHPRDLNPKYFYELV